MEQPGNYPDTAEGFLFLLQEERFQNITSVLYSQDINSFNLHIETTDGMKITFSEYTLSTASPLFTVYFPQGYSNYIYRSITYDLSIKSDSCIPVVKGQEIPNPTSDLQAIKVLEKGLELLQQLSRLPPNELFNLVVAEK